MFDLGNNKFESVAGDTIHSFAKELIKQQRKSDNYIVGVFNGIELGVNQYENPMSLYWQYMYKMELVRSIKL